MEIYFICSICQKSRMAKFNSKIEKSLCPFFIFAPVMLALWRSEVSFVLRYVYHMLLPLYSVHSRLWIVFDVAVVQFSQNESVHTLNMSN